jgi:hypothetical protein
MVMNFQEIGPGDTGYETFTMVNLGTAPLVGTVTDTCAYFNVIEGAGPFTLAPAESLSIGVTFNPDTVGTYYCCIPTGCEYCSGLHCTGVASETGSVRDDKEQESFRLWQNWPNPAGSSTTIRYSLASACHVRLVIYDVRGRRVATLKDEFQQPGRRTVVWNMTSATGASVSPGIYFYRLQAGEYSAVKKMVLLR